MGERNEVRVSDADDEMLAIKAVAAALAPLDERAAHRVLGWASEKFLHARVTEAQTSVDVWLKGLADGMSAVADGAQRAGVSQMHMLTAIDRLYQEATKDAETAALQGTEPGGSDR